MCGINGFILFDHSEDSADRSELKSKLMLMNDTIAHRGPDAEGILIKFPIGFGFRRLSILDLSDAANQPMLSNDGNVVLIFNGEIYNYIEIRNELISKGYQFRTECDSEVIINSYLEYGESCVEHFNGMWAFAIYDFSKKRLFCSRDRMGVKPFYYVHRENILIFSSELKSLHAAWDLRRANLSKVYEYLAYGYRINDGETFLENCAELLPGTNLICENKQVKTKRYWKLKENLFQHNSQLDFHQEFTNLFENAVKLRYRSDVPVALLLSGGLDSSSIAKVTDNLIEKGELEQNEIHAFIASFPSFYEDETAIAREFIKTCRHIKLHEMLIDTRNIIEHFDDIIYSLDHPLGSFASIAHNNIMKACRENDIKVVLNGQGSDEAYAGYDRYISGVYLVDQLLSRKGKFFTEFKHLNQQNKYPFLFLLIQMLKSVLNQPFASYLRAKYQEKSISSLNRDFVKDHFKHYRSEYHFSLKGNNFNEYLLNQINHQGLNTILHYEDISSMNQSIEIRSPFLDYRLMEFAFSIPVDLKFKNGVTKVIQRETIGKTLLGSITNNRAKIGFSTPFTQYLVRDKNFKNYIQDLLNSQSFLAKNIWDSKKVAKVFSRPSKYSLFPFWRVINLEVWSRVYQINNV